MSSLLHMLQTFSMNVADQCSTIDERLIQWTRKVILRCPKKLQEKLSVPAFHDTVVMVSFLFVGTLLALILNYATHSIINISFVYMLTIVITARFTSRYVYGIIGSIIGILFINFFFTYPYMHLNFMLTGYPIAFLSMLIISSVVSAATTSLKKQAEIIAEREKDLAVAEKEKIRANLLRGISHDLRTPLTSIIGSANTYIENSEYLSEQDRRQLVGNIQEDANWLLNMVENILTVTRIHTGNAQVTKSYEPIEEVLSEAVFRLQKRLPTAQVNVRVPDEFLMIPMDAILIEQVIINLIENSITHSHSSLPVECYVTSSEDTVTFHVRDYGVGIPEYKLPDIFNGTGSSTAVAPDGRKGMGIGLSICKTIVDAHGGVIRAFNLDQGAEFCFSLPKE